MTRPSAQVKPKGSKAFAALLKVANSLTGYTVHITTCRVRFGGKVCTCGLGPLEDYVEKLARGAR